LCRAPASDKFRLGTIVPCPYLRRVSPRGNCAVPLRLMDGIEPPTNAWMI
jgi:hypothetical protein